MTQDKCQRPGKAKDINQGHNRSILLLMEEKQGLHEGYLPSQLTFIGTSHCESYITAGHSSSITKRDTSVPEVQP